MSDKANSTEQTHLEAGGAYEIIRNRLNQQGEILAKKLNTLNEQRLATFGSTEMTVIGQTRIRTENNCIPRDILEMGRYLLFGYNVFVGMKSETAVSDVFSLHEMAQTKEGFEFTQIPFEQNFLSDTRFINDFKELYRFYKEARLSQLRNASGRKLAVFQVGKTLQDAKVFRWAIDIENNINYIDNRGERDNVYPPSHDFEWISTTRNDHIVGKYPHISILDAVFVETIGGTLTIKIENNTEDGLGIYREPVDDPNQSLTDAQIRYVKLGILIVLKIRPYREEHWRYLIFNTLTKQVNRIDAIGQGCIQLPEDHGLIFPGGYTLQSGETKIFEGENMAEMTFKRVIRSPNGEDVLYIFHQAELGKLVLFSYNLIRKTVQNPIVCHGYSIFDDGRMVIFRAQDDNPSRVHAMQIWQTPYATEEYSTQVPKDGSYLAKISNPELVRGISDSYSIKRLLDEQQPTLITYEQLIAAINRTLDTYHWLGHQEVGDLLSTFKELLATAELIQDEFEKVELLRKQAEQFLIEAEDSQALLLADTEKTETWEKVEEFVDRLTRLRTQRGHLITLREMRYVDLEKLEELEQIIIERFDQLSQMTVAFLLNDNALQPYHHDLESYLREINNFDRSHEIVPLQEKLAETGEGLDLLTEVLSDLQVEDAEARTRILEGISEVYAKLNRAKAELALRRKALLSSEAVSEFAAQFKLFSQSVTSAMSLVDTPEKADDQLSRLMVQLEDLESRFSEFDEFMLQINEKREEVYTSFQNRKQALIEDRQRRALNLSSAAERILQGIKRRAATLKNPDEQNAFFASDAMVLKIRDLIKKLNELGDNIKADDIEGQLKSARDQASRELRDKQEIFAEDGAVIILGKHRFSVNTQILELTLVVHEVDNRPKMAIHLSGTDFFQDLEDTQLNEAKAYWERHLVSESPNVYRSEYLAALLFFKAQQESAFAETLRKAALTENGLLTLIRQLTAEHYDEGYERGVHDVDAAMILEKLLSLDSSADLLRFGPICRGVVHLFWAFYDNKEQRQIWESSAKSLQQLQTLFGGGWQAFANTLIVELNRAIKQFLKKQSLSLPAPDLIQTGEYLLEELKSGPDFTTSMEAMRLAHDFKQVLEERDKRREFEEGLRTLRNTLSNQFALTLAWLSGYDTQVERSFRHYYVEAVGVLLTGTHLARHVNSATTEIKATGLLGQHPRIKERTLHLLLDEFILRLQHFMEIDVPAFRAYRQLRQQIVERERKQLRLQEFKPQALTSFVRNRLINEVYLPLIGDNFAKQMGTLGDEKRTDLMGMLLLISPPGYGKTTLMEYLAHRLGLIFVKINCPTLGHQVTAVDPAEAPNATARQELEKLNLALEMGNNVMLYLDDIQHSNPEFLQKFISMADAQRKIEGVWRGQSQTYDLRGKRFCLVMAGNPYTESGETFKIPDMLANRADIYNLGDVLSGKESLFALSYIENSLTSNATLAPLATRDLQDVYRFVRLAHGEEVPSSEFSHSYSATELHEITNVLKKLFRIQAVLLKVNQQYILSAAQDNRYRTEPPFKLQGSYRNMNKLAEKVVAVMNEAELENLIEDHYLGEAQTLTSGTEENLLKLAELRGYMTQTQQERWAKIKSTFNRLQAQGDETADPVTRLVNQLSQLVEKLDSIHQAVKSTAQQHATQQIEQTQQLNTYLSALPELLQITQTQTQNQSEQTQQLLHTLADAKFDINVVNQMPSGLEITLQKLIGVIDSTLLPVVQKFERKSRLDLVMWERIKDISETLKTLQKEAFMQGQLKRQFQPFKLDEDEE